MDTVMAAAKYGSYVGEVRRLRLLNGRILIEDKDLSGDIKSGALYLPKHDNNLVVARVLQCADTSLNWNAPKKPFCRRSEVPFVIKVGDKVLIDRRMGERITVNGKPCRIVTENQILAVIED